jgi:hypothetical protein
MRIGENPAKGGRGPRSDAQIRVVVPVYIPDDTGYFAEAATILGLCLDSLHVTSGSETRITVVANACHPEIVETLTARQRAGAIDQLVISHDNLGKVDGFLTGARGSWEPVVVVSDADVLWRSGWQVALTSILARFPECGVVGASPAPNLEAYATSATVLGGLAKRELDRRAVADPDDLVRFAASVGAPDLFAGHETAQLVVDRADVTALVGAGHFAYGFRRKALDDVAPEPCLGWERESLDMPLDAAGWWRLATPAAWALHLGNAVEPWMAGELEAQRSGPQSRQLPLPRVRPGRPSRLGVLPMAVRDRVAVRAARRIADRGLRAARSPRPGAQPDQW